MVKWSDSPLIKIKSCYRKRYLTIGRKKQFIGLLQQYYSSFSDCAKPDGKSPERRQL